MLFVEVGGAIEKLSTGLSAQRVPILLRILSGTDHLVDFVAARFEHRPDRDAMVMRRRYGPALAFPERRLRCPAAALDRPQALQQRLAHQRIGQIDADAVAA